MKLKERIRQHREGEKWQPPIRLYAQARLPKQNANFRIVVMQDYLSQISMTLEGEDGSQIEAVAGEILARHIWDTAIQNGIEKPEQFNGWKLRLKPATRPHFYEWRLERL